MNIGLYPSKWCTYVYCTALFVCYMAGATWNCCRLGARSVYVIQPDVPVDSVTLFEATLIRRVPGACVFICNLPPAHSAEWPGSFTCHCGNTWVGGTGTKTRVSTESWPWRIKFSSCLCRDVQSSGVVWKSRWPSWAPVPYKPYGFCGRKAPCLLTRHMLSELKSCVCESRGGRPGLPSLISLMVSVDVKHHVYLLDTCCQSSRAVCVKVEVAVLGSRPL